MIQFSVKRAAEARGLGRSWRAAQPGHKSTNDEQLSLSPGRDVARIQRVSG
jgi:hypothetical protein